MRAKMDRNECGKRKVVILLTRYSDGLSSFLRCVTGKEYTHASISLENGVFYSFNYRGFCEETMEKHRRRGVSKSILFEFSVSEETYERIQRKLTYFIMHREELRYTRLGVFLCLLHIPFRWEKHFFCSQFVALMLEGSLEFPLCRAAALYLPGHFMEELGKSPFLRSVNYNVV